MNITFLIGNGFDLNLGLDTRYDDFLQEYTKEDDHDSEMIKKFKANILEKHEQWSNAELAFGKYTETIATEGGTADDYYECYENFCNALSEYLLRQEDRLNLKALEDLISSEFAAAVLNPWNGFRSHQQDQILSFVKNCPGGYRYNFITFNYTTILDYCARFLKKNDRLLGTRVYAGSRYSNEVGTLLHVHGTYYRDMILGVNDEGQIANPGLFAGFGEEYLDQLVKIKANGMAEEDTDSKAWKLLDGSDLIYVYGMSLGETDAIWWDRISIILNKKKTARLILHCYDAPIRELFSRKYLLYVKKVKQKFLSYSSLPEAQKEKLLDRIHIDDNNIFCELYGLVHSEKNEPKVYADICPLDGQPLR